MTPQQQEMVDERTCRILEALQQCGDREQPEDFLADEWACLEVAAIVVAPLYDLDPRDERIRIRLQRAAHAALKAECTRLQQEAR